MQTRVVSHSPLSSTSSTTTTPFSPKKKTMSVTQTYYLAHKARAKLSSEAARSDHNLRLLVGHANLLDSLMLELADAEREQESWFNQSVRVASPKNEQKHIQWADTVIEEPEADWEAEDAESESDSDSEDGEEDIEMADAVALQRVSSNMPAALAHDDIYEDEDDEDYAHLSLTRSPSHSASPPELEHDSDSSEDELMPPSPPTILLPSFSNEKHHEEESFYEEQFYLPQRNPARLVSAISVY